MSTLAKDRLASLLAKAGPRPSEMVAQAKANPVLSMADQRANVVEWAKLDPANILNLMADIGMSKVVDAMAQQRAEIGDAMPRRADITAAQCSLFDNWGSERRPNKNKGEANAGAPRYQVTMELWTVQPGTPLRHNINSAWQGTGALLDEKELTKRLKKLHDAKGRPWRKRNDSDQVGDDLAAFGDRLLALHARHPGYLWGPVFTTVGFTRYFLGHYVGADVSTIGTLNAEVILRHEGDAEFRFTNFAAMLNNNRPLPQYVAGHSRMSSRQEDSLWRTTKL